MGCDGNMITNDSSHASRSNSGFSLVELLATMLIVTMTALVVATAVPAAIRAYRGLVDSSNAQSLLSDTATTLRDELAFSEWKEPAGGILEYTSDKDGKDYTLKIYAGPSDGTAAAGTKITVGELVKIDASKIIYKIVPESAAVSSSGIDLYVTCDDDDPIGQNGNAVVFSKLKVLKNEGDTDHVLAETNTFAVRMMTPAKVATP